LVNKKIGALEDEFRKLNEELGPNELAELDSVAEEYARIIKKDTKRIAAFQADPMGYLQNPKKVTMGKMSEAVMSVSLREIAKERKLNLFENVHMQFIDEAGNELGGSQAEMDIIMLGSNKIVEYVSVKYDIGSFKIGKDKDLMREYLDIPTDKKGIKKYIRERFGNSDYSEVENVLVKYNGNQSMSISDFKNKYLNQLETVEELKIVPGTPSPGNTEKGGYVHRFTHDAMVKETAKLVASKLGITIII
jgi:hypothetical protein